MVLFDLKKPNDKGRYVDLYRINCRSNIFVTLVFAQWMFFDWLGDELSKDDGRLCGCHVLTADYNLDPLRSFIEFPE